MISSRARRCAARIAGALARPSAAVVCASAAVALASGISEAASSAAPPPPAGEATAGAQAVLSNFRTLSRWAYPQTAAAARVLPSPGARVVGRLHFLTEDGQAEVYMALRSDTGGGRSWIQVALPGRPNGAFGWVPADALGELHSVRDYLRVNRETLRATLFRSRRAIWSAQIGVGRPGLSTPAGRFYVREKLRAIDGPVYGPFALGTSAYAPHLTEWPGGGVIGIHGTNEPQLIPGRPSHGCIRMRNADITRLWQLVRVGTPIEIV